MRNIVKALNILWHEDYVSLSSEILVFHHRQQNSVAGARGLCSGKGQDSNCGLPFNEQQEQT
jgi:hypothetical protein